MLPVRSPLPYSFETVNKFLIYASRTALSKFIGTPQSRNPPTSKVSPSLRPLIAYEGVLQIWAKLKKVLLRICPNILIFAFNNVRIFNFRQNSISISLKEIRIGLLPVITKVDSR